MTPEQWQQVMDAFEASREASPSDRLGLIEQWCRADREVRSEVESLLAVYDAGHSALDRSALNPKQIGDYQLNRIVGEGGMGVVYEAADIRTGERVALKVMKAGLQPNPHLISRFLTETSIIQKLQHTNIPRFIDCGTTSDGSPWLAIEYLNGEVITEYCRRNNLDVSQRVRLFRECLKAVQYAHEHAVLHRDIKPSNVMVTNDGVPKLLDFGIARLANLDGGWTGDATRTQFRMLTPEYASPEQLTGGRVSPATDVYSLGILLYELLTGVRPFQSGRHTEEDAIRTICTTPPQPPSRTLAETDRTRTIAVGSKAIERPVDGSLDAIVLKALRKNPLERYASVNDFDRDLGNWLEGRRVRAGRDLWLYTARQTVSRFGFPVTAGLAVVMAAIAGVVAWRGQQLAGESAAETGRPVVAVLGLLNSSSRQSVDWVSTALSEMVSNELIGSGELRILSGDETARLKNELQLKPAAEYTKDLAGRIRSVSGTRFLVTGKYQAVDELPGSAIRVEWHLENTGTGQTRIVKASEGTLSELPGMARQASDALLAALGKTQGQGTLAASHANNLASIRYYAEGLDKWRHYDALMARSLLEQAVSADPANGLAHAALGVTLVNLGYDPKATEEARKAIALAASLPREQALSVRAIASEILRDWKGAAETYGALWGYFSDNSEYGIGLAKAQGLSGHPAEALATIAKLHTLPGAAGQDPRIDLAEAAAYEGSGDTPKEMTAAQHAVEKARKLGSRLGLAEALFFEGRGFSTSGDLPAALKCYAEAEQLFREAGHLRRVVDTRNMEAVTIWNRGDLTQAKVLFQEILPQIEKLGSRAAEGSIRTNYANVLEDQGDFAQARKQYQAALELTGITGVKTQIPMLLSSLADIDRLEGHFDAAEKGFQHAIVAAQEINRPSTIAVASVNLGDLLYMQARLPAARERYETALTTGRTLKRPDLVANALVSLGTLDTVQAQFARSRAEISEALSVSQKANSKSWESIARVTLASLDIEQGRLGEAESELISAVVEFHKEERPDDEAESLSLKALVESKLGRTSDAQKTAARAEKLADASKDTQTKLEVGRNLAVVRAACGDRSGALRSLQEIEEKARKMGNLTIAIKTRSSEVELNTARTPAQVRELVAEAERHGFLVIARNASALPGGRVTSLTRRTQLPR